MTRDTYSKITDFKGLNLMFLGFIVVTKRSDGCNVGESK